MLRNDTLNSKAGDFRKPIYFPQRVSAIAPTVLRP